MPTVEIRRYSVPSDLTESQSSKADLLGAAIAFAKQANGPAHVAVGTIEGQSGVQLIVEWKNDIKNVAQSTLYITFESDLKKTLGQSTLLLQVPVAESIFGHGGPAEAAVVEFAHNQFPVSRATPEFKARVKSDFQKFDDTFKTTAHGGESWVADWLPGQRPHDAVTDELTESFLVIRGYNSVKEYTDSIKGQGFKEGLPILLAWKGHTTLWHFQREFSISN
ncbi:hypothetical protein VHEMI04398 [[Torrubiella] hemipterigena]|uniref:ABM domain-containing protein n=1 Tax=[Torrubiella] hemipterigena TaxID=1531966 RepID=A0A0A1TDP4_9HYPO|nr:hypothetical protein VHEMI04398 [[Torrubiella] hemipterigena]